MDKRATPSWITASLALVMLVVTIAWKHQEVKHAERIDALHREVQTLQTELEKQTTDNQEAQKAIEAYSAQAGDLKAAYDNALGRIKELEKDLEEAKSKVNF